MHAKRETLQCDLRQETHLGQWKTHSANKYFYVASRLYYQQIYAYERDLLQLKTLITLTLTFQLLFNQG